MSDPDIDIVGALEYLWAEVNARDAEVRDSVAVIEQRVRDLELVLHGIAIRAGVDTLVDGNRVIGPSL